MTAPPNPSPAVLPDATAIGFVHLRIRDLNQSLAFYRDLLGYRVVRKKSGMVYLAAHEAGPTQLILTEQADLKPRYKPATGLYHLAILLPDRLSLAGMLARLQQHRIPIGTGDHLVSEALYLYDPDGNGVEIYADRPREQWVYQNGMLAMTTDPVNVASLLSLLREQDPGPELLPPDTRIGHVHLQVSDLKQAEHFYCTTLGFQVTQRSYPGALFVSAGGYHHHLGFNTWHSQGTGPAPEDTAGLVAFSVEVPDGAALLALRERLKQGGYSFEAVSPGQVATRDADQNTVLLLLPEERISNGYTSWEDL